MIGEVFLTIAYMNHFVFLLHINLQCQRTIMSRNKTVRFCSTDISSTTKCAAFQSEVERPVVNPVSSTLSANRITRYKMCVLYHK